MIPHRQYAQAVPGEEEGCGSGIIDGRAFIELLDAVALLEQAGVLPYGSRYMGYILFPATGYYNLTVHLGIAFKLGFAPKFLADDLLLSYS